MRCILCGETNASMRPIDNELMGAACAACGRFTITGIARHLANTDALKFKLACWVHEQNESGVEPFIDVDVLEWMKTYPSPRARRRVERFLVRAIELTRGGFREGFQAACNELRVASWSQFPEDCLGIARHLEAEGALEKRGSPADDRYRLTVKGHFLAEEMTERRATQSQCFVAMWFGPHVVQAAYTDGIEPAIRTAGYEALRIDKSDHANKIDDQIVAEIRRSAFLVADFTGHRGGVYYEAGFAHGLGKRVIFTCAEDHLNDLHFDVRQYNTVTWNSPADLLPQLQNRILAIFGAGPLNRAAKPILLDQT